jgi:hypothetical protein
MVTTILRPNSTDANAWASGDHTDVDEEVTQPDDGDQVVPTLSASNLLTDDNDVVTLGFPNTITDVDEVTNITVWSNGMRIGWDTPEVMITGEAYTECNLPEGIDPATDYGWTSDSFNVSWNQAELDALQVSYRADVPDKADSNMLDVVYVVVTYTATGGATWGHKFIGVEGANISSVSGVAIANIASIKGVVT